MSDQPSAEADEQVTPVADEQPKVETVEFSARIALRCPAGFATTMMLQALRQEGRIEYGPEGFRGHFDDPAMQQIWDTWAGQPEVAFEVDTLSTSLTADPETQDEPIVGERSYDGAVIRTERGQVYLIVNLSRRLTDELQLRPPANFTRAIDKLSCMDGDFARVHSELKERLMRRQADAINLTVLSELIDDRGFRVAFLDERGAGDALFDALVELIAACREHGVL